MTLLQFYNIYNTNDKCISYFIYFVLFILQAVNISFVIVIFIPGFDGSFVQNFFTNVFLITYKCILTFIIVFIIMTYMISKIYENIFRVAKEIHNAHRTHNMTSLHNADHIV